MKKLNIVAVIPARAGSKGLKNKNILRLNNKSVIELSIINAKKSKYINKIAVSTDSKKIQMISKKHKVWCDKLRPKKISGNKAKLFDAIKFVTDNITHKPDILVELHPTHVFRSTKLIDNAIKIFLEHEKSDSLISVLKVKNTAHPDYVISLKKNLIKFQNSPTKFNRHFLSNKYQSSGIILISYYKNFLNNKSMVGKKCLGFEVTNEIDKIDINNSLDYKFCQFLIKYGYTKL